MLMECYKNFATKEMYRDEWDDNYWDSIIHQSELAFEKAKILNV